MHEVAQWALRHGVSHGALAELLQVLNVPPDPPRDVAPRSEAACQSEVRLAAPRCDGLLWRNNVGVLMDERGVPVRYGLANDSKRVNERVKSSDLIGFFRMTVGPEHVGHRLPVFAAIECKHARWSWGGTKEERAQQRFIQIVKTANGVGGFARGEDDLFAILQGGAPTT